VTKKAAAGERARKNPDGGAASLRRSFISLSFSARSGKEYHPALNSAVKRPEKLFFSIEPIAKFRSAAAGCNCPELRCRVIIVLNVLYEYACGNFPPPPCS